MRILSFRMFETLARGGDCFRRQSWPEGDRMSFDGAEGGTLWYYRAKDDELTPDWKLGFHDLLADDWELVQ